MSRFVTFGHVSALRFNWKSYGGTICIYIIIHIYIYISLCVYTYVFLYIYSVCECGLLAGRPQLTCFSFGPQIQETAGIN